MTFSYLKLHYYMYIVDYMYIYLLNNCIQLIAMPRTPICFNLKVIFCD